MENVAIYGSSYILMKELVGISLAKKNRNGKRILHFHTGGQRVGAYINQTRIIVVGDWRGGGCVE